MSEENAVPKKKNILLAITDALTLGVWKIFAVIFFIIWVILRGVGQMFSGIWKALGEAEGFAGVWKPLNSFFRFLGQCWGIIWYVPGVIIVGFYTGMNKSAGLRRFMLLLLLGTGGAWYYFYGPFPTWGKWHHYYDSTVSRYAPKGWYGKTANSEWVIPQIMFYAAHPSLPMGSRILLENTENGKKLVVRINDRKEHIYLSTAAANYLGITGTNPFPLQVYTKEKLLDDPEPVSQPPPQQAIQQAQPVQSVQPAQPAKPAKPIKPAKPAVDPREVPTEWVDELPVKPFEKNTPIKPAQSEPLTLSEPPPVPKPPAAPKTTPIVQVQAPPAVPKTTPIVQVQAPSPAPQTIPVAQTPPPVQPKPVAQAPKTQPKPTPVKKAPAATTTINSDDRLELSDPVLVPDRR